jgi:Uma2 family endonuclease
VPDDFDLAPALVIEILSAEQSPIRVIETILYALRSGCSLGGIGFESGLCDSDLV